MTDKPKKSYDPLKRQRLEVYGKVVNGVRHYYIVDCDKSYCSFCHESSCKLEFFLKTPQGKNFINEVYNYSVNNLPEVVSKFKDKMSIVKYIIQRCSGYDNSYDFLFTGNKLTSIKFDDDSSAKKYI